MPPASDRRVRIGLALAASVALIPAPPSNDAGELVLLGLLCALLVAGLCSRGVFTVRCFAAAAVLGLGAFVLHPSCWVVAVSLLWLAHVVARILPGRDGSPGRWATLTAMLATFAPAAFAGFIVGAGGAGAHLIRSELAFAFRDDAVPLVITLLAGFVGFALARGPESLTRGGARLVVAVISAGTLGLFVVRARFFVSAIRFPTEVYWSEAPHMLNAFKLSLGEPIYGPLRDCNSYSYSPLLELVHRAVLAPFGKALSLPYNRSLNVVWHAASTAALAWSLGPKRCSTLGRLGFVAACAVVVTSGFLAANLHPDHLTMVGFCLAILLVVSERRMPAWLFEVGLFVVPIYCTMAKLTGAGVGVGLVLGFAIPAGGPRKRPLVILAASGVVALATIPLFDATLGPFSRYAIGLQASHPIRWDHWADAFRAPEGRVFVLAVLTVLAARLRFLGAPWKEVAPVVREAVDDATRLALLTAGFMLPSLVAFLKLGGRSNSLLPMTIGAAAIFMRLASALPCAFRTVCAAPAGLALLLRVAALAPPVGAAEERTAARRLEATAAMIRGELSRGRRTLYYDGTLAWILAGARDVPLDRWETVGELELGHVPEVSAFYDRLRSGYYDSVILGAQVLTAPHENGPAPLLALLRAHFREAITPPNDAGDPGRPLMFEYVGR